MFRKHILKGAGYLRLFIEKKIPLLLKCSMSCTDRAKHHPLPPPGAPCHTLWGKQSVQHTTVCEEAQTRALGSRVCVQKQRGERGGEKRGGEGEGEDKGAGEGEGAGEEEGEKSSSRLTRKQQVTAPAPNAL